MNIAYAEVVRIKCDDINKCGMAIIIKDRYLITCRHIVEESEDIQVTINEENIKCEKVGGDQETIADSTIVLLQTEEKLNMVETKCRNDGLRSEKEEVHCYLGDRFVRIDIIGMKTTGVTAGNEGGERYNYQLSLDTKITNYEGLSGSPIFDVYGKLYGIFNGQLAQEAEAVYGYGLCSDAFEEALNRILEKVEKNEPAAEFEPAFEDSSFATYVARVCDDCPSEIQVVYADHNEYTMGFPDKDITEDEKKLKGFVYQMEMAGRECEAADAKASRDKALNMLMQIYSNSKQIPKQIQSVYISALYWVLKFAYIEKDGSPSLWENVKNLLDIAGEEPFHDFPQRHQFLAEYYIASDEGAQARKEIEMAKEMCEPEYMNTNCYADICILQICCPTIDGNEADRSDVIGNLSKALEHRPEKYCSSLIHTEAYRMLANYRTAQEDYYEAVQCLKKAFELDSGKGKSWEGCKEDDECIVSICRNALHHYKKKGIRGYRDWRQFFSFVSKSPLGESPSLCDFGEKADGEWIAEVIKYIGTPVEFDGDVDKSSEDRKEDDECIPSICHDALRRYKKKGICGYRDWYKFFYFISRSPQGKRASLCDFGEVADDAWINELIKWNNDRVPLTTAELAFEYSDSLLPDAKHIRRMLEECKEKGFYLKVTDIVIADESIPEWLTSYDEGFRRMTPKNHVMEVVTNKKMNDDGMYLYIYRYIPEDHEPLPVWHLVCTK